MPRKWGKSRIASIESKQNNKQQDNMKGYDERAPERVFAGPGLQLQKLQFQHILLKLKNLNK